MQTDFNIVKPDSDDRSGWERLYRGYASFYQVPMHQSTLETVWAWIHDKDYPFYCRVAKRTTGGLVGLIHFREMPSPLRGAKVGFLDDLFVSPEARGHGVVDALFVELNRQCQQCDWPLMRWITADNNYRARSVYEKCSTRTQWVTYQMDAE